MAGHSRSKNGVTSFAYVPAIHVFLFAAKKTWMPATSAGMTAVECVERCQTHRHAGRNAMTTPNSDGPVLCEVDGRGVAQVVLNRPERNNAYDGALITALHATLDALEQTSGLRAVVISGRGRHFQAGADLAWINAIRAASREDNIAASRATAQAIWRLNAAPVPTLALVHGACFGGGTGLAAACDVVIAAADATFSIAEARWGLTAAIIIPQLNDAIGVRQVRRYALTGERFDAAEARRIGLVHEVVPAAELAAAGARIVDALLQNGPLAIAETKALALQSAWANFGEGAADILIEQHADKRRSAEAAEGLASFAEKRAARWR
jgi:methylglutaconyl-CoA hydratase